MSRPIIRIHNSETNEIIDREMNDAEFAEHNKMLETLAQEKIDREAKAQAKASAQSKLAALGLTADEIAALSK